MENIKKAATVADQKIYRDKWLESLLNNKKKPW
jgi:hypothetical protein